MDFPTTPIKQNASNEIHQLSVVHSPPILKSDTEQMNEVTPEDGLSHLESYPHGLSAKKKVAAHKVVESMQNDNQANDYDMSIEVVRNNSDDKSEALDSLDYGSTPIKGEPLNKSVNDISPENKSPYTINDPFLNKRENEGTPDNESSSKKIKLDNVPDLHQENSKVMRENTGESLEINQNNQSPELISPIRIEMIDNNEPNPPNELFQGNGNTDQHFTSHEIENKGLDEPFDNSHKLTPISHNSISNYEDIDLHVDIDSVNKRNEELNGQIFALNERINSMHVIQDKLKVELKQLKLNNDLITEEKLNLQKHIDTHQNKSKEENEILKKELDGLKSELSSLQSNQTLLQEKYDQIYNENIKLQNAKDMLTNEVETLQKSLSDTADILEDLTAQNKDLEDRLDKITSSKKYIEEEKNEINKELRRLMTQLDGKDNEIATLEDKVKNLIENERTHSRDLIDQVANLNNDKMKLEESLKKDENSHKAEAQYLRDTIEEKEKQITDLKEEISHSINDKLIVEENLKEKISELNTIKKSYEETNDNATIRTAEVNELNNEILSLKESKSHLESNISRQEKQIQQIQHEYTEAMEEKRDLQIELESLQHAKNKQEEASNNNSGSVSLEEYQQIKSENEQLRSKLINQSNTISSSDSTLQKYKEQIENLKRKADQREAEFNKRLKKLSEDLYIQYSSKHEQKVAALKANYDDRYESKFERLRNENNALQQEVEQLNGKISLERREKQELLKELGN